MKSVFMLAVPYEGLLEPAFTTREKAEKYWEETLDMMTEYGGGVVEVKVVESSKEDSQ